MRRNTDHSRQPKVLKALCALTGILSLAAGSAGAVELGDAQVESTLGQPLRLSIPFALNSNEQMADFCIRLGQSVDSIIPTVSRANVAVTGNRIVITGEAVIRDPLLNLRLAIDCPYTPQITRQYTLVVDPAEFAQNSIMVADQPAAAPQESPASSPATRSIPVADAPDVAAPIEESAVTTAAAPPVPIDRSPIPMNAEYRVQAGDTASAIASRIEGRSNSLRTAVDLIVASNPDAFMDGDAARLMSGSLLRIPLMDAGSESLAEIPAGVSQGRREYAPVATPRTLPGTSIIAAAPEPTTEPDPAGEPETVAEQEPVVESEPVAAQASMVSETAAVEPVAEFPEPVMEPATDTGADASEPVSASAEPDNGAANDDAGSGTADNTARPAVEPADGDLRPGDVVMPVANETGARTVPTVETPVVETASSGTVGDWLWLAWPAAGAVLLVAGVLLLGRRIRGAFNSIAIGAPDKPKADPKSLQEVPKPGEETPEPVMTAPEPVIESPAPTAEIPETAQTDEPVSDPRSVVDDVDFEFTDTIASDEISLDADLDAGTGLQDGTDLDVAEDFGFSASVQENNELDHEIGDDAEREHEVSPTDVIPTAHRENVAAILEEEVVPESDDYDMSMIVDATKQSIDDSQLTAQDLQAVPVDSVSTDEYSISDDTLATEADLAALEQDYQDEYTQTQALSKEIEEAAAELAAKLDDDIDDDDPTIDEPALTIEDPALDPTAQMPARAPATDPTAVMPSPTAGDDATAQMPTQIANPDETAEMQIDDITAEVTVRIPANSGAENDDIADDEVTAKLIAAGNEPTVEMPLDADRSDDDSQD